MQKITIIQKGILLAKPAKPVLMLQAKPVTNITNSVAPIIIAIFSLIFIILFYLLTKLHF